MKLFGFLLLLLALAAGFAVVSKPSQEALEKQIHAEILFDAKEMKVGEDDDFLSGTMKLACRMAPEDCARQIFNTMVKFRVEDQIVLRIAEVTIQDERRTCYGFYNTWKCDHDQAEP